MEQVKSDDIKLLFDTDVLVDYLRGFPQAIQFLEKNHSTATCYLSSITIAELYAGVLEGEERVILDRFIREFYIVEVDANLAVQGGLLRRDHRRQHGTGLADAIIAATAQQLQAHLVTLNKKHYPIITNLMIPYNKSHQGSGPDHSDI